MEMGMPVCSVNPIRLLAQLCQWEEKKGTVSFIQINEP